MSQVYICTCCDKVVPAAEQVKGVEYAKGEFTIIDKNDGARQIERGIVLAGFASASSISPDRISKSYYIGPDRGSEHRLAVFAAALSAAGVVSIGWWSSRGKKHQVALSVHPHAIVMSQLHESAMLRCASAIATARLDTRDNDVTAALSDICNRKYSLTDFSIFTDEVTGRLVGAEAVASQPDHNKTQRLRSNSN